MATPSQLVLRSDCDLEAGRRESILDRWNAQAAEQGVNVAYTAEVKAIHGTGDPIPGSIQKQVATQRDGTSEQKEIQGPARQIRRESVRVVVGPSVYICV